MNVNRMVELVTQYEFGSDWQKNNAEDLLMRAYEYAHGQCYDDLEMSDIIRWAKRTIAKRSHARIKRRAMADIADSLGMKVVRGVVSGKLYLE